MPNQAVVIQKPTQTSASASIPKQGLAGPKGDRGEKGDKGDRGEKGDKGDIGPEGPEYQGNDLPDFTLIFDNKLI